MAKHQIIYTSCMRGIDGVNDGQQIYSYDKGFAECKSEEVKSLFTYQLPSLRPGVIMTEELAMTMPSAFSYRFLRNGSVAVTLNTYLGRDYMGSAGRFGNHLTHSIVCDFEDMDLYPCELYGGGSLRSSMGYEEVNNPEPPDFLPEPILDKGYLVDIDRVIDFLGIGDNIEYFKKMVASMLRFPTEKKRIVICDKTDHLILWIAALHYALPLELAKKVNFTSYEFDPELSPAQICGVISEGSRYSVDTYISSGRHFVFDFINEEFNDVDSKGELIEFIDTAFSFSYDSLTDFHDFIRNHTSYRAVDENYYAAYDLYSLVTDGLGDLKENQFINALGFMDEFARKNVKVEVARKIIQEGYLMNELQDDYALALIEFLLKLMPSLDRGLQDQIKGLIINRIIMLLSESEIAKDEFLESYNKIDGLARGNGLSIPAELMEESNRDSLLNVLTKKVSLWKVKFLIGMISQYVKDTNLPVEELYPNTSIGSLYFGILKGAYGRGRSNGFSVIEEILDNFKDTIMNFVNITLNVEGFLNDLDLGEMDKKHLWGYFTKHVLDRSKSDIDEINAVFVEYERLEDLFLLYQEGIKTETEFEGKREVFRNTFEYWFLKCPRYAHEYSERVLQVYEKAYEESLDSLTNEEIYKYGKEILHLAMEMEIKAPYVGLLMERIIKFLPLERPSKEHEVYIQEMKDYQICIGDKKIDGRLLLFCIGMTLEKIIDPKDVKKYSSKILAYSHKEGGDVTGLSDKALEKYFQWILENPLKPSLKAEDFVIIYDLFKMSAKSRGIFIDIANKAVYKKCKDEKEYEDYSEFLKFIFEKGSIDDIENSGKILRKLSKNRLEELDEEMKGYFKDKKKAILAWNKMKEAASNTSSLLNNLSGLFKRNKD